SLYNNPLLANYRNYNNEIYILRSYPLIQDVLEERNFGVSFYREGNLRSSEAYDYVPFALRVIDRRGITRQKFYIQAGDTQTYMLSPNGETNPTEKSPRSFAYGDTVEYAGLRLTVSLRSADMLNPYKNVPFLINYRSERSITGQYVGRLEAEWAQEGAGVMNL